MSGPPLPAAQSAARWSAAGYVISVIVVTLFLHLSLQAVRGNRVRDQAARSHAARAALAWTIAAAEAERGAEKSAGTDTEHLEQSTRRALQAIPSQPLIFSARENRYCCGAKAAARRTRWPNVLPSR